MIFVGTTSVTHGRALRSATRPPVTKRRAFALDRRDLVRSVDDVVARSFDVVDRSSSAASESPSSKTTCENALTVAAGAGADGRFCVRLPDNKLDILRPIGARANVD